MITDTMTWDEIVKHFKDIGEKLDRNRKYQKYLEKLKIDPYRKYKDGFRHLPAWKYDLGNEEITYIMPVDLQGEGPLVIQYSIFRYHNRKYVVSFGSDTMPNFFNWHSIVRYYERFRGMDITEETVIDANMIGLMLARNGYHVNADFKLKNNNDFNFISIRKDGAFLGSRDEKKYILKTFITRDMMFKYQQQIDEDLFQALQLFAKEIYGDVI